MENSYFYTIRYKKYILLDPSRRKQKIKNGILYIVRILRILSNTIWANQYSSNLLGGQLQYVTTIPRQDIHLLSR
jgi:hypothetical protein